MKDILRDLKFNHIGFAVRQEKDALVMLESLGYSIGDRIYDPLQNVYVRLSTAQSVRASNSYSQGIRANPPSTPSYRNTTS